jgi:hypothetical protein
MNKRSSKRAKGFFIVIEGIDGSGKATQKPNLPGNI